AARAVLVAALVERLDQGVVAAVRRHAEGEEQLVLDDRARQGDDALAGVVVDLGDAQRLVGRADEARRGDARGHAEQDHAERLVAAAEPARLDEAAAGAAALGVVHALDDLDLVDELLDDRGADGAEGRAGGVLTVDDVLALGPGRAAEADAGGVAAGGRRHVDHGREVAAGAAERDGAHVVGLDLRDLGGVVARPGLDVDL